MWGVVETDPSAQLKRSHERRRLRSSNATPGGETLGRAPASADKPPYSPSNDVAMSSALFPASAAQNDREQLTLAQSFGSMLEQPLPRALLWGQIGEDRRHFTTL